MTGKEAKDLLARVEQEGFDYAFTHYSSFEEIKDMEFHKLRQAFRDARERLASYIGFEE